MLALALLTAVALADSTPAEPCAPRARGGVEAFVVTVPAQPAARDTLARVTVCVVGGAPARIASYHGQLSFDSTTARVVKVEKPADGMRVENAKLAGSVRFAGAAPQGFTDPAFVTVTFRMRRAGTSPRVQLRMVELNGTDGSNLLTQLVLPEARP